MSGELLGVARVLKAPIDDLYSSSKGGVKKRLRRWRADRNINELYKKIYSFRKVKTIWQVDRPVDLNSFYYPSGLVISGEKYPVSKIDELPDYTGVVIQGTVGQGKSIFLRYLCSQELKRGTRIPVFIELRKIGKYGSIKELIFSSLSDLGFSVDDDVFDYFCSSGRMVFLLDGFDEVPADSAMAVISYIESIMSRYPAVKFVITSRPSCSIQRSSFFSVYDLSSLEPSDHPRILKKLIDDSEQRSSLIKALKDSHTDIQELLTTPLMMTLMVLLYRSFQEIPNDFTDFYSKLFSTLLIKHDGAKPGFIRERRCSSGERELQQAFERFCFECSKENKVSMSSNDAGDISDVATEDFDFSPSDFLYDISKVACVLIEDGFDYQFIHKSVREYYSASFVSRQNEGFSIKFYEKMLTTSGGWEQELSFLAILDKYRFNKYFFKKLIETNLNYWGLDNFNSIEECEGHGFFEKADINFYFGEDFSLKMITEAEFFYTLPLRLYSPFSALLDAAGESFWKLLSEIRNVEDCELRKVLIEVDDRDTPGKLYKLNIYSIADYLDIEKETFDRHYDILRKLRERYDSVLQSITEQDRKVDLLDF
ncbi:MULTISPECIES: NACHT domain-containing protein [Thalassolituus]|uniref:NACHT domain-containing protein n=1 Tax=Thalassolituus TaxID=187492 RepID=UPI000C54B97C|nr:MULTISPECIES: NACHT domain-containing protein [Thalassolituus]MAX87977.1 hypothetical protein [Oceanospirillaceae bacterium]|tara:strand:- start:430 stop:2217 length:1788 start_codon:yes stop_codon:yes gene_type:complete